ncbi:MAG: hypothetical protein ACLQRH_15055 [Acidimicrobiales bacterium]
MSDLVTTTPGQRTALTHVARGLHAKFQGVLGQETIEALVRLGQLQGIGRKSNRDRQAPRAGRWVGTSKTECGLHA